MPDQLTLAAWRKERGFTQRELASLLSGMLGRPVHQQSIWGWETGGVMPGADVAEAIRTLSGDRVTGSSFGRDGAGSEGRKPCPPA